MIRLVIADDHAVVRRGLKQILTAEADMTVLAEARNGHEALQYARTPGAQVVVLDITMPGRNGIETLRDIRQEHPRLPVLVLSMHPEDQYAMRALKAGAAGYLTKESAPDELVKAVRRIVAGGRYVSAALAERLAMDLGAVDTEKPPHERLSDREYQVLCLIASGKPVSEVADELALSVKTISTYRRRILDKMLMKNNAEITRYAIENGLVA